MVQLKNLLSVAALTLITGVSAQSCAALGGSCHAYCGGAARNARECSSNNDYAGPFDEECLCASGTNFMNNIDECLSCGWPLWSDYGAFLTAALSVCDLPSEPTGLCAPTTTTSAVESSITSDDSSSTDVIISSSAVSSTSSAAPTEEPNCAALGGSCHAYCGGAARNARECSSNNDYAGPFDEECLCASGTNFMNNIDECLSCGWPLWSDYGAFLTAALSVCDLPSEPTGLCAPTTTTSAVESSITSDDSSSTDVIISSSAVSSTSSAAPTEEPNCAALGGSCHAYCGGAARNARECSSNNDYAGPFDEECLCASGTNFMNNIDECLSCGWPLWSDYGAFLTAALSVCDLPSEPTGLCAPTTTTSAVESSITSDDSSSTDVIISSSAVSSTSSAAPTEEPNCAALGGSCHAYCGGAARNARECSSNNDYAGPFDEECLCASGTNFMNNIDECLSCGWPLWSDYGAFLTAALSVCDLPSEPTGACNPNVESSSTVSSSGVSSDVSASSTEAPASSDVSASASSDIVSSSSSSSVPTGVIEPSITGSLNDGLPEWTVSVPGALGPWNELSFNATKIGSFVYTNIGLAVNGVAVEDVTVTVTDDIVTLLFTEAVELSDNVTITFGGELTDSSAVTASAILTITTPDARLGKRAVLVYEFEFTIDASEVSSSESSSASDGATISSEDASATSGSAVTSEDASATSDSAVTSESASSGAISSTGFANSTVTEDDVKTTVITVTSCEEDKCSEAAVTTGVTVVTSTINGAETEYTTYCPLTTVKPSTTVITITSCEEDKCSTGKVTTGLTTVTSVKEGKTTTYTTYCPIETETETEKDVTTTEAEKDYTSTEQITLTVNGKPTTVPAVPSTPTSTVISVSTFEGAGQRLVAGSTFFALLFSFLLI